MDLTPRIRTGKIGLAVAECRAVNGNAEGIAPAIRGNNKMLQQTEHRHIVTDEEILGGEPIVKGTRTPVRAIVELWRQGIAPETIPSQLPHLNLAEVFDALSYYSDHTGEINAQIERNRIPDDVTDLT